MAIKNVVTLLNNASASGPATPVSIGGVYVYSIMGVFTGASSKLQLMAPDNSSYIDVPNTTFTLAGMVAPVYIPSGSTVKAVLTGGTPAAMYASLALVQGGDD